MIFRRLATASPITILGLRRIRPRRRGQFVLAGGKLRGGSLLLSPFHHFIALHFIIGRSPRVLPKRVLIKFQLSEQRDRIQSLIKFSKLCLHLFRYRVRSQHSSIRSLRLIILLDNLAAAPFFGDQLLRRLKEIYIEPEHAVKRCELLASRTTFVTIIT